MNRPTFTLLLISAFLFLCNFGFAQLNNFNLSDYKLPDLKRSTLETNFNLSGSNNSYVGFDQSTQPFDETGNKQFYSNIDVNYNHYLNNAKNQRVTDIGLDFSTNSYTNKKDKKKINRSSYIRPVVYFKTDNRHYYTPKAFFEINTILNYRYFKDNKFYIDDNDGSEKEDYIQNHNFLTYLPVAVGIGRIEQVQDARHAVYLFDELSKAGCISPDKTKEEIIELAKLISKLKNKRFFDSRLRKMAEIESVDSFFVAKGYLKNSGASYFTTLSDTWDYGNRPARHSGTRISIGVAPGYYFSAYENPTGNFDDYFYNHKQRAFLLQGNFAIQHQKPINLFWQSWLDLFGYVGLSRGKFKNETLGLQESQTRISDMRLEFYHTIGYYPNTRTDIQLSYTLKFGQTFDKTDQLNDIQGFEGMGFKFAANLSVNYFISPKFSVNLSSSFNYLWQDSKDRIVYNFNTPTGSIYLQDTSLQFNSTYYEKNIASRFRANLTYSLF